MRARPYWPSTLSPAYEPTRRSPTSVSVERKGGAATVGMKSNLAPPILAARHATGVPPSLESNARA